MNHAPISQQTLEDMLIALQCEQDNQGYFVVDEPKLVRCIVNWPSGARFSGIGLVLGGVTFWAESPDFMPLDNALVACAGANITQLMPRESTPPPPDVMLACMRMVKA